MVIAKKIIITFFLVFVILFSFSKVFAETTTINGINVQPVTNPASDKTEDIGNKIVGAIYVVGIIVSVGMLIIIGLKFMMGSTEEKAEYKKTLLPYFIAAVGFFAATKILQVLYSFAQEIFK